MKKIALSVVIPCYNRDSILDNTLAGLVAQTFHPAAWEVILVDNNSTESLEAIHRRWYGRLPLTLVQQPKLPHPFALCRARNTGMRLAKGRWIVSLDSDCILNPDYLATVHALQSQKDTTSAMFTGIRRYISGSDISAEQILHTPDLLENLPPGTSPAHGRTKDGRLPDIQRLKKQPHPYDFMYGCNVVYPRALALKCGGYDQKYDGQWGFEDTDFAYRMYLEGCEMRFEDGLAVYHQDPDDPLPPERYNISDNPNWKRICDTIPGFREYKSARYRRLNPAIKFD